MKTENVMNKLGADCSREKPRTEKWRQSLRLSYYVSTFLNSKYTIMQWKQRILKTRRVRKAIRVGRISKNKIK